ncbi:uncharacterized protein LOC110448033 [Mizuhopecten yessoensis]|uniref:Uncharacterized protein n=1 Tax=Mizuhopecten yessoensis TaxID=6573 RepID=A0A210R5U9_MIZYE|nr:uncharacterized protein LOC110448033 [Mizuhopecten yessoensis]OWF56402.1 hypothetical protein KP79_PYT00063 [Mizuhopecten yessoensis]
MAACSRPSRAVKELKAVLVEQKRNELMTLKIISCDCVGGKPFSAASVVTQEILSTFQDFPTEKSCTLSFEDVWDVRKLHALVEMNSDKEEKEDQNEDFPQKKRKLNRPNEEIEAFGNLEKYLFDLDYHINCMKKVLQSSKDSRRMSGTEVVKVLNVHLFNPLSGGKCLIDTHITKEDSCVCSCGCGIQMEKGPTGIGVESCWHGFVDMIVRGNQPVQVLQSTDPQEEVKMAVEVNKDEHLFDFISSQSLGYSQVIAETITNSFAQVNKHPSLSGLPIPAFGCTPGQILVFAYDSHNDMLLKKMVDMKLFHEDVSAATIVMLWLYINFTSFMKRDITDTVRKPYLSEFKAEFCSSRSVVSCYKKAACGIVGFHHASNWPKLNFYSSANMTYIQE